MSANVRPLEWPRTRGPGGRFGGERGEASVTGSSDVRPGFQPSRSEALDLLQEFTDDPALLKHALAVEAAMRAMARKLGGDEETWGIVGLIHDFDYQRYPGPDQHVHQGRRILTERGWPAEWVEAVASHADYMGIPRETPMARALFAVDELCGFLIACTLVRPDRCIATLPWKSVKKKLKDKAFARAVSRQDIRRGAEELGFELSEHVLFVRDALAGIASELGLEG